MLAFSADINGWADVFFIIGIICMIVWLVLVARDKRRP